MEIQISAFGALIGLLIAIFLITKKITPTYCLMIGALAGGLLGGADITQVIEIMFEGAKDMVPSILRILASGILAGALMKTKSAEKMADVIIRKIGQKWALFALALASLTLCSIGVFVDITIITVAPIGIAIGKKTGIHTSAILLAMIGGGKAGNVISPNPNTLVTAEAFHVDFLQLIAKNVIPALSALVITIILASFLAKRMNVNKKYDDSTEDKENNLPSIWRALFGPFIVVCLLSLRPIFHIAIDPMIALALGGISCCVATRNRKHLKENMEYGLEQVIGVAILLLGTGTLAGVIGNSDLQIQTVQFLNDVKMPAFLLAPVAGILMAGATASTTAGAAIASQTFGSSLLASGVSTIGAASMVHAGATVLDSLPHGSFFYATAGCMKMNTKNRLKLIPFEACIGLTTTLVASLLYFFFG